MKTPTWLGLAALLAVPAWAAAGDDLERANKAIQGKVVDHTHNHGYDRRILSKSLCEKRDLYVYLPPCYDPNKYYPLVIYLHGILQDEKSFLQVVRPLDKAIVSGRLPAVIVAAPDGTLQGEQEGFEPGSFFINSVAGDFADWVACDVFNFMVSHYKIRPECKAHVLVGVSMGGMGAFNIAMRNRNQFGIVAGIMPVLNVRWMDLQGDYMADFDPYNWGWRNVADDPDEVVGKFGLTKLRVKHLVYPVFGETNFNILLASRENPIELVDRTHLVNGQLDMFVGYAARDNFNLDAQAESFLYLLKSRRIHAHSVCVDGDHSVKSGLELLPCTIDWIAERLRYHKVADPLELPIIKPLQ